MHARSDDEIFIEVTLIDGINDSAADARALVEFLRPFAQACKINLIPYNDTGVQCYKPATMEATLAFQSIVREEGGWLTFVRTPRGYLDACACGQLATSLMKKHQ